MTTNWKSLGKVKRRHHMSDHLPESFSLAAILAEQCMHNKEDSESEWLVSDNPEINPITVNLKTGSHVAEQFSWVPLPYCSPPGHPFPIKSLALSTYVSPQPIHFWVLAKSPIWALETEVLPATEGWCWSWSSILWPPDGKSWLIKNDPYDGKDWRQEKSTTKDKMVGWNH